MSREQSLMLRINTLDDFRVELSRIIMDYQNEILEIRGWTITNNEDDFLRSYIYQKGDKIFLDADHAIEEEFCNE